MKIFQWCVYIYELIKIAEIIQKTRHGYPVFWIEIVVYRYGIPFLFHSSVLDPF